MKKLAKLTCGALLALALLLSVLSVPAFAVEKTLTTDKTTYTEGEPIMVTATGEGTDWVGIFKKGEQLGTVQSIYWYYVDKDGYTSGQTVNISETLKNDRKDLESLPVGEYTIYLVADDGVSMDKVLVSVDITVVPMSKTLKTDKTVYTEGDPIMVTATGNKLDWVALYKKDETPGGGVDSIYWYYVDQEDAASGDTTDLRKTRLNDSRKADADLPAGEYTVYLLENDGYTVLAKVEITITAKTVEPQPVEKTLTTDKTTYTEGDPILVTATGEGTDWVGIFKKGEVPGDVDSIYWYYVAKEGTASGDTKNLRETKLNDSRKADADLPAGEYTVYLLENDGYTELAKVEITITAKTVNPPATGDQGLTLAILAVTAGLTALALGRRFSRKRG